MVEKSLDRFASRIARFDVCVCDVNGAKSGGDDKRCKMEAHLSGRQPLAVRADAATLDRAISDAIHKMKTRIERDEARMQPVAVNLRPCCSCGEG